MVDLWGQKVDLLIFAVYGWCVVCWGFSQKHKIGNIDIIANFVFPYICNFLSYLQHMMLVNIKLDIGGYNMIEFEGYRLHWSSSFLVAQLK